MRENCTSGSVRGASGNGRPYREKGEAQAEILQEPEYRCKAQGRMAP